MIAINWSVIDNNINYVLYLNWKYEGIGKRIRTKICAAKVGKNKIEGAVKGGGVGMTKKKQSTDATLNRIVDMRDPYDMRRTSHTRLNWDYITDDPI